MIPPPISVLTIQTALTDRQNIIRRSLSPSQNCRAKWLKATTTCKVTLFTSHQS